MSQTRVLFRFSLFVVSLSLLVSQAAVADIYRCTAVGTGAPEYINNVKEAQTRGCKLLAGGNVTVVQGSPVQKGAVRVASATPSGSSGPRTDGSPDQKSRDSDSRSILTSELKKAEARLAEQQKEYNNGEPEKQGIEGRNYQRYLDRVAELKEGIVRNQSDIAGLKREIARLPGGN